jgi:hypothetical protein
MVPGPMVPPAYTYRPPTNTWMLSGVMVAIGAFFVGIGFVVLGLGVVATTSSPDYGAAFYALLGVGIVFMGLSWPFARMGPRIR